MGEHWLLNHDQRVRKWEFFPGNSDKSYINYRSLVKLNFSSLQNDEFAFLADLTYNDFFYKPEIWLEIHFTKKKPVITGSF